MPPVRFAPESYGGPSPRSQHPALALPLHKGDDMPPPLLAADSLSPVHCESPPRPFRIVTAARLEQGLWSSATGPQRVLMLLGAATLLLGCDLCSHVENASLLSQHGLSQVLSPPLELSCRRNISAPLDSPVVHLQGCPVQGGSGFGEKTKGLEELEAFRGCLPKEVRGAWFKVNVERYFAEDQEWRPAERAGNLASVEVVSPSLRIGDYLASASIAAMVPGSDVELLASCDGSEAAASGRYSARTMGRAGNSFFSGDPVFLSDGDVKVTFLVGDAGEVSVLAGLMKGELHLSRTSLHSLYSLMHLPELGAVGLGSLDTAQMQRSLAGSARVSAVHLWSLRVLGFAVTWLGMSLLLFPNHVYPDFCGGYCLLRSAPGAALTAATCALACWSYFHYPKVSFAAALAAAPVLLACAAGANFKALFWQVREHYQPWASEEEEPGVPFHVLEASGAVEGAFGRATRTAAFGIGLSLVVAGPAVQSFALVNVFGGVWGGLQLQ